MGRKLGPFDMKDLERIVSTPEAMSVIFALSKRFSMLLCGGILNRHDVSMSWNGFLENRGLPPAQLPDEVWNLILTTAADWIEKHIPDYWNEIDLCIEQCFEKLYPQPETEDE